MMPRWAMEEMEGCGEKNLRIVDVGEHEWYEEANRSRAGWRVLCWVGLENCREARTSQAHASL